MVSQFLIPPLPSISENSPPPQPQVLPSLARPEPRPGPWITTLPSPPTHANAQPSIPQRNHPPIVLQRPLKPPAPATFLPSRLTLPSIFYLLHIVPYLRVYRLTRGPYIENNFHGLFLLLWSANIQLRLVHPPWMATGKGYFYGWEWAVTNWAVGWYQGMQGEDIKAAGSFRKIIGKKVAEYWEEAEVRYASALDGKDIPKLCGTASAPGPAEPLVVAVAETIALVGVWIPAMCFLSFWSGNSNSGLIHAVLNVFALWMDVYYRGYFGGYFGESMPGPALPLQLLMDRWTSDVLKVIIAYGLLRSLCRGIEGAWSGYRVFKEGGFNHEVQASDPVQDEEEFYRGFEREEGAGEQTALVESSGSEFGEFVSAPW